MTRDSTRCPAPFNMAAHVLQHAERLQDKPALIIAKRDQPAEIWRYSQLEQAIRGTATGLLQQGLRPGERILMRLGNTVEFPLTFLAALAIGAVPVPTSAALTEPEVQRIIRELAPALIVAAPNVPCPTRADCPADCPVVQASRLEQFHALPPADYDFGDPDRLGYIIYTSGTSGKPMAVCHAHRAVWARRMMWQGWYGLGPDDRMLHAGAFNWTYTLGTGLMDPWSAGATAIVPAPGSRSEDLPELMKTHGASIFAAAPGVYRQMLKTCNKLTLPDLRHGLSAGEKLPDLTRRKWADATGTPIYEAFGMSECSTFISGSPARPAPEGTLGFPQPGRHVAIVDKNGTPLEPGGEGTIAIHRSDPGLMLGYWQAETETRARFCGDWFLTGDSGLLCPDGAIRYMGRTDDMMNAGGYRVSPIEVEQALCTHPEITEAAAVEVAVKQGVTVIAAFYSGPAALDDAALSHYIASRLARYKQPRIYCHVTELPKGANGKLLRRHLRQQFEADHDTA